MGRFKLDAPLTFVSATTSSTSTTIVPSGVVTYTANYTIANDASYTGSIVNSAEARANVGELIIRLMIRVMIPQPPRLMIQQRLL